MKAYLINPFNKTITEVDYDGNYKSIYTMISTEDNKVNTFECVNLNQHDDTIYVDEEGLFVPRSEQAFFVFNGAFLAGKGLVLGTNDEGESISPHGSLSTLISSNVIKFVDNQQVPARLY